MDPSPDRTAQPSSSATSTATTVPPYLPAWANCELETRYSSTAFDGSTVEFHVEGVQKYPKDHFPTEDVYLSTLRPELRLITCGGDFDPALGHYRDNVIAFATATPAAD